MSPTLKSLRALSDATRLRIVALLATPLLAWIVLAQLLAVTPSGAATKPTDSKPPIPPDLLIENKPLPNEDNAIYLWRRAANELTKTDDRIKAIIRYAAQPEAASPNDDDHAAVQNWLVKNREALALMEQSLAKPQAKWLAQRGEELQPELWSLVQLTQARNVIADQLATEGKWDEARRLLEGNLRLTQTAIESQAAMIHYMAGTRVRTLTQRAMLRLANHRDTPVPIMEQLLQTLPPLHSETNTYLRLLAVEFTIYEYPGTDMKWFAEAWAKPDARQLVSLAYPEEFQRPFMVLTDPGLVALHPKPFDELANLERVTSTYRRYRTNVVSTWTNRIEADQTAVDRLQTELLDEIETLMELVEHEPLPLSQKSIGKCRPLYLVLNNPIGRILQCQNSLFAMDDSKVFQNRTEREAVRAVLAAMIFERRKGQLPHSLDELQEEKLLSAVPWDYFANAPLKYAKDRRLIWSAGEDAEDDQGDGSLTAIWGGLDAIWKIPNRIN